MGIGRSIPPMSARFSFRLAHQSQDGARHSVLASTAVSQARRARSDAPYHQGLVQGFKARMLSENSHPDPLPRERETPMTASGEITNR